MACPFFLPLRRFEQEAWAYTPRMPLGAAYSGECHARPEDVMEPPAAAQRDLCNCGYARSRCERFPAACGTDAVRFSITGEEPGCTKLVYIFEKDHAPAEHGTLEYAAGGDFPGDLLGPVAAAQVRAFIESHIRRAAASAAGA